VCPKLHYSSSPSFSAAAGLPPVARHRK
jgi:hypothetical protein